VRILRLLRCCPALALCVTVIALPRAADAQTLNDVLSFLLTNRSIPTEDFVRDEAAAVATGDAISRFLQTELGTLPVSSSAGGFTYRLEPTLGTTLRSSDSFGPFFTERSLTSGARQISIGVSYQLARYSDIDGRNLRDGSLVATASKLRTETAPFDVETLTLRLRSDTMTVQSTIGITDRFDVGAALPLIRLTLDGERVDNYRGREAVQASASGTSSGPGDLILRAKYNVLRRGASGVALGLEGHLPTGDEENLLGSGEATLTPRGIVSFEGPRAGIHGSGGYTFGGFSDAIDFSGAGTFTATPRVTIVGELSGRRFSSVGRLIDTTAPHPTLANVETVRLGTTDEATTRMIVLAGVKWNVGSTWLLNVNVLRPLTDAGLNAGWTPTITFDRSFGR
jgi:hypothetical protein